MISLVPKSTLAEMNEAVESCKHAFRTWSKTTILQRQQIMFRYQDLIKKNMVWFFLQEKRILEIKYLEKNC